MDNHSTKHQDYEGYLDRWDRRSHGLRVDPPMREREGDNLISVMRAKRRVFGSKKVGLLINCRSDRLSSLFRGLGAGVYRSLKRID